MARFAVLAIIACFNLSCVESEITSNIDGRVLRPNAVLSEIMPKKSGRLCEYEFEAISTSLSTGKKQRICFCSYNGKPISFNSEKDYFLLKDNHPDASFYSLVFKVKSPTPRELRRDSETIWVAECV